MYYKNVNDGFTFYECIQLIDQCIENKLLMPDPKNDNNVLVYRAAGEIDPEGWYSQNVMDAASELATSTEGQKALYDALAEKGVEAEFYEMPNFEIAEKHLKNKEDFER